MDAAAEDERTRNQEQTDEARVDFQKEATTHRGEAPCDGSTVTGIENRSVIAASVVCLACLFHHVLA